ncbi:MAG: putative acyl-CoA dehydrogenase [Solirubrobacteraceae bacterium]|jgi:putative acyl-CoA dehydrogenase|nr:putative acyl-CoA dehydrogenase [Solirubrobacteraceae bacterium]
MATVQRPPGDTHEVFNQPPPLTGHNVFESNRPLVEALEREGGGWARAQVSALGTRDGDAQVQEWARQANENPPRLVTHDRYGNRVDEVEFHPAWHELLGIAVQNEIPSLAWRRPEPGAHVARGALMMLCPEAGVGCPVSMTYAIIPALRKQPELAAEWEPRLTSNVYDQRFVPAAGKAGALAGMGMTEKQGGSDVRANTTVARPLNGGGPGAEYELTGHKWFCSAPMCDVFLMLAQAEGGLSCFLVPRFTPDGTRNVFHLQRLKDKLGNRSNASSEVELRGTWAQMVGEEGRGVPTIIEMVNHTRLDCVLGSTSGMRAAVEQATWHAAHRTAFGRTLAEQPLMRNVLADLCVESEAATVTAMRLARAFDDSDQELFKRIATAVSKYWVCKRAPAVAGEALECLGGNGYVEESGLPRLYREMPLNSIWEGSGNVQCLDVLRALAKSPETFEAFFAEVGESAGADPRLDAFVTATRDEFTDPEGIESRARRIVERMAKALQGSLLVRYSPPAVADAYIASRLDGDAGLAFGTLPASADFGAIVERHSVAA